MPKAVKATKSTPAATKKQAAPAAKAKGAAGAKKAASATKATAKPTPKPAGTAARVATKASNAPAATKKAAKAAPVKGAAAKKAATKTTTTPKVSTIPAKKTATKATAAPAPEKKAAKKVVLDKFLLEQRELLHEERSSHTAQAEALRAEADALAQEMEPGDAEFGEEGGEGGTLSIDRERDLMLSAQARQAVEEIDAALLKIDAGTYGLCEICGKPIPKPRLKAIPYARHCVECKQGGLSRR